MSLCFEGHITVPQNAVQLCFSFVFITEMKSVYSAVRTGSLNTAVSAPYLKG